MKKAEEPDYRALLEEIDGLVIVDREGRILVMDDALARSCYINGQPLNKDTAVGRDIMEVIPTTNIMKCFENEEGQVADYYFVEGRAIVSTRKPIFRNGEIVAAIEYDLFGIGGEHLTDFLSKTAKMSKERTEFKNEFSSILQTNYTIHSIIGSSDKIRRMKDEIRTASRYTSTVLIEGETGSGKELVAHALHSLSDRQLAPFIEVNCAAIPENLIESELFGYEEGSFTGGKQGGKKGKFEMANHGTIFLDEINQLPLSAQPKLLRVLQEHEVNPIGSEKNIPVDVRVIATSNEDLKEMVAQGRFREDLYYRLNILNIKVPSLSERKSDIPEIADNLIRRLNSHFDKQIVGISQKALNALKRYDWPGNVRELNNVIERAMSRCEGDKLKMMHFHEDFIHQYQNLDEADDAPLEDTLAHVRERAERKAILDALANCRGNKVQAARSLGISRSLIHKKIRQFHITPEEY